MNMNREMVEIVSEFIEVTDLYIDPRQIINMQDELMLDLQYLELMFKKDKYPELLNISNTLDSVVRLSHASFDVGTASVEKYYFDQIHFSNSFKVVIENLVSSLHSKGKAKAELFRDNSVHIKAVKRYFACVSNSFRELVMDEPLDKIIKAFKGFNAANMMNESK